MKYSINVEGVELVMDKDCYDFLKDKHIQFSGGGYPYISLHRMFFNPQEGMVVLEKHGFNTAFEAAEWRDNYLRNNGMVYNSYLNFLTFEDICKYRKKG